MPALRKSLAELTSADIQLLVDDEWVEDEILEFKETLSHSSSGKPDPWLGDQSEVGNSAKRDVLAEVVAMALAEKIGKAKAHEIVEAACNASRKERKHLRDVVRDDASIGKHFSAEEVDGFFDARRYLGMAEEFVDRVVAASKKSGTDTDG